ncbi:MAG: Ig-like domain-containing protein [Phycisphaerae bacterium]|nr:Ig-like domain-containing protein [Phycisphaerae bacterium]
MHAQPRDEGLVGYWSFDEGSGDTVHDSSGHGNHGDIYGAEWAEGISGAGLWFDGTEDSVRIPNSPSLNPTSVTMVAWFNGQVIAGTTNYAYLIEKWQWIPSYPSGYGYRIQVQVAGQNSFQGLVGIGDGTYYGTGWTAFSSDVWHCAVVTYDDSTGITRAYLDGDLTAGTTITAQPIPPTEGPLFIDAWLHFCGIIDEVRIYNRAMSEEEIQELYSFYGGFTNAFSWATFDAGDHGVGDNPDGYIGGAFDGRYVYFAPYYNGDTFHGEVLRYDTSSEFYDASSWYVYDAGEHGVGDDPDGYQGAVFDGRYVYFAPHDNGTGAHAEVLRYDTMGDFEAPASWGAFNAEASPVSAKGGYIGGVFDGRYVYFAPGGTGVPHGEVLRYDTASGFSDPLSWTTYDAGDHGVGNDPDGYVGPVFDGQYVYFAPHYNGESRHGEVLRYDTGGDFRQASSWGTYDPGEHGVGDDPDGYSGTVFDGRYVYLAPMHNGTNYHGEVLRYDTHEEFANVGSWSVFDAGEQGIGENPDGYSGAIFDGRYVCFVPSHDDDGYHGEVLRYDTLGNFEDIASWATYDYGEHCGGGCDDPDGYGSGAFDGRYVYFAPYRNGESTWHGEVLRYDTAAGVPGVDVSVSADDVTLTLIDPDVEAAITVHNLGIEEASDVVVEVFKHVGAAGFVSVGTDVIASIQPASHASASITFTPDFIGQEIKVVTSLSGVAYDGNPSNNQVIVIWNGGGDDPIVLAVEAEHDGDDQPDVAGRYIADVALDNTFYATVLGGASHITGVSFQMDADPPVAGMKQADGRWKATFDMGGLEGGVAHTLTVIATDALGTPSEPEELAIDVIPLPSWAEEWNSGFDGYYALAGFVPVEWRLDQEMPQDWLVIGGKLNRFRGGLFTTAVVPLDGPALDGTIDPALYVSVLDGFATVNFTVDGLEVESETLDIKETVDPEDDATYEAAVNLYNQLSYTPGFDEETLELLGVYIGFEKDFEHDPIEVNLTPTPVFFSIGGWPMSFEADMSFTPGVGLCITVYASGSGFEFAQPTYVEPRLNIQVAGTINIIDVGLAAIGASIQPNVTFFYNIAYVPPLSWDGDWIIEFILDICARLRLGWCPFCEHYDLGCLTVFEHTWYEEDKAEGRWQKAEGDPPVDPEGVLNRPVIVGGLGRGERVLVYTLDDPYGAGAEIMAQVDPGTGMWEPAARVTNDVYPDLDATLAYTHDGQAVAMWTKVEMTADEIDEYTTMDEIIGTFDLYWSIWDGAEWSAEAALTDDAFADGMAKVAFSDMTSNGLALWCRDEANDFDDVTADEVAYAAWDGASWSAPVYLTADTLGDRQIAVCYHAGTSAALAVWTKEIDPVDHLLTVYYAEWDGSTWTVPTPVPGVSEEWVAQVNVSPLSDGRVLAAWGVQADDGWQVKVAIFDATTGWGDIEVVQSQLALVDGLQLQVSADDVVHVFWHGFTLDDDLFGVSKDIGSRSDTWVGPTTLTSGAEIEWQLTGTLDATGELSLVYAREQGRSREPLPPNRNGLPDELGGSTVPGGGNWTVTDDDLTLLGEPWLHETVTIEAVLTNTGTTDSVQTTAQFWLGDPNAPESTPIGDPIDVAGIPPLDSIIIESEEFTFEQVGYVDVYLVVTAPVAEVDPSDNQAILGIDVINNDTIPPQVLQTTMTPLRDSGRLGARLAVTFDEPMTPPTVQDVLLVGDTSGQAVPDQVSVDPTGEVMTVVFEDYLSQDMYTFTIVASRVTDEAGNPLDGNGDGTGGDDYVVTFSLLPGDFDHDGDVDIDDFNTFAECLAGPDVFDPPPGCNPGDFINADLDGDSDVDLVDFVTFQESFTG